MDELYCESYPEPCYDDECVAHGDRCGGCGAFIIEAAQPGDGEGYYHLRYGVDCRSAKIMTF